jgi:hypothetical protein
MQITPGGRQADFANLIYQIGEIQEGNSLTFSACGPYFSL